MKSLSDKPAYILLETLIALSVISISVTLFWYSAMSQNVNQNKLEFHYSEVRLLRDIELLVQIDNLDALDSFGYFPLKIAKTSDSVIEYFTYDGQKRVIFLQELSY